MPASVIAHRAPSALVDNNHHSANEEIVFFGNGSQTDGVFGG